MALTPEFLLITGARQVGKSTACHRAVELMQRADLQVSGLLTARTGPHDLTVTEIHSGESYPLTAPFEEHTRHHTNDQGHAAGFHPRHFNISPEAMARSSEALKSAFPTEVLIIDEIGPLELRHHEGWYEALALLHREEHKVAIVVVRLELLGDLVSALPGLWFGILHVTRSNRDSVPEAITRKALAACGVTDAVDRSLNSGGD
jgi:nucleoside-triphosphatase THEP1